MNITNLSKAHALRERRINLDSIDNAGMIISQIIACGLNQCSRNAARYRERVIFTGHAYWKEYN